MPQLASNKVEYYNTLATQTTAKLTASMENWTSFLETAARLYKYPYHDQLMIFAQRPDATACADFDTWNKTMGRYVRRGSKGIALIDHTTGTPKIKYVYDLADTGTRQSSRPVNLWQLGEEHMDTVFYALEQNYSVSDIYLTDVLETIAASLAEEFWENHATDILDILANSFLEEYTEDTVGVRFREAVTVSTTYVLMTRCGIKPETPFTHEDFLPVFEFNTPDTIAALGTAVSTISRQVLRDIELSIKIYERTKANETEQPDLHDHRRVSVPESGFESFADTTSGQIWTYADVLFTGTPSGAVQSSDSVGEAVPPSVGDRTDSEPENGADDAGVGEAERGDGDDEGEEPDAVGADDEQSESTGRGSDTDGIDLRITEPTPYIRGTQISIFDMIPSEAEQIQAIDEAERVEHTPFAFSVSQEDIDTVLRMGSNMADHRMRIVAEYMKQKSPQENGEFLQTIFHGGSGFHTASGELCVWYAEDGIHMSKGRSARYVPNAQIYDWTDAANRIREMLDAGTYATNVEIAEAVHHVRKLLAGQLCDLYSSFSDVAREQYFDPAMFQGTHPDAVERVTQMLSDPATQNVISEEISRFAADYAQDRKLLRFHYLPPADLAKGIRELPDMTYSFETAQTSLPEVRQFITEDEIDEAFTSRGSGYERGQYRIHDFLTGAHTDKEKIAFLKKEYGLGGGSPALSGAAYSDEWHDGKGIRYKKQDCPDVEISWPKVLKRLETLIRQDRYLTQDERDSLRSLHDAAAVYTPFKEEHTDTIVLYQVGKVYEIYGEDAHTAGELLDRYVYYQDLPDIGRVDMCNISARQLDESVEKLWLEHDVAVLSLSEGAWKTDMFPRKEAEIALPDSGLQEPIEITSESIDTERMGPRYLVSVYHHSENGFDTKLEYQSIEEAEKAAQGCVEGTMEDDGFRYDGAAVYDQTEQVYLRIYGDSPDAKAQEQVRNTAIERYVPLVREMVEQDTAYRNACGHSDRENARIECTAAVRRAVLASEDMELLKLFSDDPDFRENLHEMVFDTTYDQLHELLRPVAQENVDTPDKTALYTVGDTVYLDNRPFEIVQITDSHVHLLDPALAYPIERVESIENFYMLLQRDRRNEHITDFLPAILDTTDTDLQEILTEDGGLLSQTDKDTISEWFQNGDGNTRVAERLAEKFAGTVETMALVTGENADYRATARGLEITIEDKFHTEQFYRWGEIASVIRAMYQHERDGFAPKQEVQAVPEPEKPEATTETVAFYPAEENHMPFDVVVQRIKVDEPKTPEPPPTEAELDEVPISIQIDGEWQTFPNVEAAEQASLENFRQNLRNNARNFHITDDNLGAGGPKAKYQANITAIKLLQYLESNGFQANPEQQELLSRYVGWGGLAEAFDPNKPNWQTEYIELQALLTPEEYEAARASTLNAHYTSPTVIKAIYEAVGNMGFQSGNILEPSMGVGNFFGLLPEEMQSSRLYGVELDSITGRIAKQLYPKANITVAGFETTDRRDFFDLAIGNVPFGNYKVNDKAYNKLGFTIHNYFFAKSLDQVRPGGVVAFVTSRYTMDSESPEVRRYLAERADLLGAIRLPNNAFKANSGTDVVSDIIFLQKRDRPQVIEPDWVHLGLTEDGFGINSYFIDHPEMVLGTLTEVSTQYGRQDFTVEPIEGANLAEQLHEAVQHIRGTYTEAELPDIGEDEKATTSIPADPNVKNYSFTMMDGEVYYRENSIMVQPSLNATAKERVRGMVELRDCVHDLINRQLEGASDDEIHEIQAHLNTLYDHYTMEFGLINERANRLAFADDSSYYLLCSLEILDDDKENQKPKLKRKADIFTKRTILPPTVITSVETAAEALAVSMGEKARVDMAYMSELCGKTPDEIAADLRGVIFRLPESPDTFVMSDEYLSGNVREKLQTATDAAQSDPRFSVNVEALTAAQPKRLEAHEIEVRLGSTWIDPRYIQDFMYEVFNPPQKSREKISVLYSELTSEWRITGKSVDGYSLNACHVYGTKRINAYEILEATLNLRDVRLYDTRIVDGKEKSVLNMPETTLAQQKQQVIKDAFRDWLWQDSDRRHTLVDKYNELFNSTRPREYNGEHIVFHGMNPEITLREHQKNAVAHILYGNNVLLAHEVGSGKTFEMVAAVMESKHLGLCHKPIIVVPNHLTDQWAGEFLRLYPSANILVTTKRDFEPARRKKFCARIATGEYDAIIIGHSQFEKIPMSKERQEQLLHEQIDEVTAGILEAEEANAEHFTVKQMERTRKSLETRLAKLNDDSRKDSVITFEQLGVDRLYVDEAHSFKNGFIQTKMRNVAGLSTTEAQKSSDMLMKCRYMDEITGYHGIVFATGTPVSNSMTELFVMMRYLQHQTLAKKGLTHFDSWASTFGETTTAIELAPEGTGYRARTRFAKFFNLPELLAMFREVADIKTADQLNLPRPEAEYHNVVTQPSEIQKAMVQELSERATRVHNGSVDSTVDNMLKITTDGRKLGLDQRIVNPDLPDNPDSKVNQCVENIFTIWQDTAADRLTQLVFCDLSTPNGTIHMEVEDGETVMFDFQNVYDDIRRKLVSRGIPSEEIAFIHEANTDVQKAALFAKVRSGQVRVLMGSTSKMGAGTNVQDRLIALHDLDAPWKPGDLEQRKGRIVRQGNRNPRVHIYRYVTEGTFDAYSWQTLENKQRFISQIMTSKSPVRTCEDVDETALSFAEVKALCAGDDRIREKMDLDVKVAKLRLLKADHQSKQHWLEDCVKIRYPAAIARLTTEMENLYLDQKTAERHPHPTDGFAGMEIGGIPYTEKEDAGKALLASFKDIQDTASTHIGSYRGFQLYTRLEEFGSKRVLLLKDMETHRVELGGDVFGNIVRIDNQLKNIPGRIQARESELQSIREQLVTAQSEMGKPFPQEDELQQMTARLVELNGALDLEKGIQPEQEQSGTSDAPDAPEPRELPVIPETAEPQKKPSVLARLHEMKAAGPTNSSPHKKHQEEVL